MAGPDTRLRKKSFPGFISAISLERRLKLLGIKGWVLDSLIVVLIFNKTITIKTVLDLDAAELLNVHS